MISWRDTGLIIAQRPHSENSAIIEVLTQEHGRHAGVVRGATSSKRAPYLQIGNHVAVTWSARLEAHLGSYVIEPIKAFGAPYLSHRVLTAGLGSFASMAHLYLPEHLPLEGFYDLSFALIADSDPTTWPDRYALWELELLSFLGFGLDLSQCAVTGATQDLRYISPRTGCAVSGTGAGEWAPKLFAYPDLFKGNMPTGADDLRAAFDVLGHFLTRELAAEARLGQLPTARDRFVRLAISDKSAGDARDKT